jgi:hypothetical protein
MILMIGIVGIGICGSYICIAEPKLFTNHLYHYFFID